MSYCKITIATLLGAATVTLTGLAPNASAAVTRMGVMPDSNYGPATNYGTDCAATAEAYVDNADEPVSFYDNGVLLGVVRPLGGIALFSWYPQATGPHTLSAVQAPDVTPIATVNVRVGTGVPVGFACLVFGD
ncbi:hypothetical protein ACQP1G_15660 [Nocardia sp. CA-107356]|uniref:hypothetical protein n=1 Tax=Nocardia sp. CA-107356 TaxID=3239972 RepID=UPI003D8FDFAE